MNHGLRSPLRRTALAACTVAVGFLFAAQASAQAYGRMDNDQRERFRRELRQHDAQRAERGRGNDAQRRAPPDEGRLSRDERQQLREQLRQARPDDGRRGGRR
ncbi:MAG: hypothetical protein LT102_13800 [Burkholderiaceae bacterium]|nr:hypothetical protein [Burkholderiaceae bacterium]